MKQLVKSEFGVTLEASEDDGHDIVKTRMFVIVMTVAMVIIMIMMTMMVAHRYAIFLCSGDVEI